MRLGTTIVISFIILCRTVHAQSFSSESIILQGNAYTGTSGSRISTVGSIPLVFSTTAPVGQPIRFFTGADGTLRVAELDGAGNAWFTGPMAVGATTGVYPNTQLAVSSLHPTAGVGILADLRSTSTATGLFVDNIGDNGSEAAGILLQSQSNGTGTGLRIGGSGPTLRTGIDITGGTGLRYNALTDGTASAIDIGGTVRPNRGIDISTGGANNVGVHATANTLGVGLIGESSSSSYTNKLTAIGTGLFGIARSKSNASRDTLTGVSAFVLREGQGSSGVVSFGVHSVSQLSTTLGRGTAIGIRAHALTSGLGDEIGIGVTSNAPTDGFSYVVEQGDVYLGSSTLYQPAILVGRIADGETTTHIYSTQQSGNIYMVGAQNVNNPQNADIGINSGTIVFVNGNGINVDIGGITNPQEGRVVFLLADGTPMTIVSEDVRVNEPHRIRCSNNNLITGDYGSVQLWYNSEEQRWRVLSFVP